MQWHEHEWIEIPAGFAYLGSDDADPFASENEKPARRVFIDRFLISKYPTTNAQLASFHASTGIAPHPGWKHAAIQGREHFPATFVSWDLGKAYCGWLSRKLSRRADLPTESQWEKAARGEGGRVWPWGDIFDPRLCCCAESGLGDFCSVEQLSEGASPYGVMHMSGGVWEWCVDFHHRGHAGTATINPVELVPGLRRVVKGGSAFCTKEIVRPAGRDWTNNVNQGGADDGLRVILTDE